MLLFIPNTLSSRLISKNLKIEVSMTIRKPVVLYDCETWVFTLREECSIIIFKNRIPRRIFGPRRDGDGVWRRIHNEELHNLYLNIED